MELVKIIAALLGLVLGLIVSVPITTVAIDTVVAMINRSGSDPQISILGSADNGKETTIVLPGILARCSEQIAPVLDVYASRGEVICIDYGSFRMDADKIVKIAAANVVRAQESDRTINLVGISIGGMIAPDVIAELADVSGVRVSLIDPPTGSETFAMLPKPIGGTVFTIVDVLSPGVLSNLWGNQVLKLMAVPPKPENIEVPEGKSDADAEVYRQSIIRKAKAGLSGHSFSMWWSQLDLMCNRLVWYSQLKRVPVTYYECTGSNDVKNETVRQPEAVEAWLKKVPKMKIIEVPTQHAAFLEASTTWNRVLSGN